MTPAQGISYRDALASLLIVALGLSLQPDWVLAAQHGVFGRIKDGDRQYAERALRETLESRSSGDPGFWRNESSGNSGAFTALRTFKIKTGNFCRDYRETAVVAQKMASRELTACRTTGGMWITIE